MHSVCVCTPMHVDASEDSMAWKVRFVAARGLSLVSSVCKSQTTKDGFSAVACERLEEVRDREGDSRVLEALRGGQVSLDSHSVRCRLHC